MPSQPKRALPHFRNYPYGQLVVALALLCGGWCAVQAQPARGIPVDPGVEAQRRRDQETEAQRARAAERPDVFTPAADGQPPGELQFPEETPCFTIRNVVWQDPEPPAWLRERGLAAKGHCLGNRGLQALQNHLVSELVDRGYITSRVLIPEQSLAAGTLTLRYIPGTIARVRSDGMPGWWRMALPGAPGDALDQRDIDQALENIRRLAGQSDATIDLEPGAALGETDLVLHPGTGKRWHGYIGGDNAGLDATGKNQLSAGLILDSPFFLYDQLSLAWNSNADMGNSNAGARSSSISYSIPFGYWSVFGNASKSTYHQTIAGFEEPLVYAGTSKQIDGGVSVVPYRGTHYKGTVTAKLFRKWSSNNIDDIDIDVQHRDVVGYEFDLGHRHYVGDAMLDIGGGVRSTLPGMSNAPGVVIGDPDWNGRSTLLLARLAAYVPFGIADQNLSYLSSWQWQHATTPLVPADYFTIGHRYAVRGFDGPMTLSAESGWAWRNDLSLNMGDTGQQLYTGVDAGRVSGPTTEYLSGTTLVGAVVGVRGHVPMPHVSATYDLSAGWPLKKPDGFKADIPAVALSVLFTF